MKCTDCASVRSKRGYEHYPEPHPKVCTHTSTPISMADALPVDFGCDFGEAKPPPDVDLVKRYNDRAMDYAQRPTITQAETADALYNICSAIEYLRREKRGES